MWSIGFVGIGLRRNRAPYQTVRTAPRGVKKDLRASIGAVTGLVRAVRYLTIVPVGGPPGRQQAAQPLADLGRSAAWFPVVGLGLGVVLAAIEWMATRVFPPLLAVLLTISAWKLLTGGLHLDGLADCLDGLAGRDAEHRLAIMRDSRIGVFGAVGLILVLLLGVGALAEMAEGRRWRALIAAPTIARATPLLLARLFPPARRDGQGASFQASVGRGSTLGAAGVAALVSVGTLGWPGAAALVAGSGAALLVAWQLATRLGGITGDVLGAAVELAELAVLLVLAAWAGGQR
jgi:adenosylcobinamide-GDP ribazoletransferase